MTLRGQLLINEPLARYTSWRIGGPAARLYQPADLDDLAAFLKSLPEREPLLWLGLGSNTLIRDGGFNGTVIVTQGALTKIGHIGEWQVQAEAGVACAALARYCARLGLTGLEFMAGIPGTVGGALRMNAGCFGGETWNWVESVTTMDIKGHQRTRSTTDYQVGYRHVVGPEAEWFTGATFRLQAGDKETSLAKIRELLDSRAATQPTGEHNCGSVFRNPVGNHAGKLIESCQLKGFRIGDAMVSPKHANFIINVGQATATDIEKLMRHVHAKVLETHGIQLEPEVRIVGE
ncbi:MAG: UDP-N-acetylmuramate dehydrogenase [Proteobacteria bacterium]|nr:UDP-N-acetylmuramate dehydrogenase [Pseudomonadota bacterium]